MRIAIEINPDVLIAAGSVLSFVALAVLAGFVASLILKRVKG